MQFDHDLQSPYADLFLSIREKLLASGKLHELYRAKQTSYPDDHNTAIVMMRVREDGIHLVFARGAQLARTYPFLLGSGKHVRYVVLRDKEALRRLPLQEMIEASLILAMEHRQMRKMRAASASRSRTDSNR